ncbi:hypothetical protein HS088_TW14G00571 [Tripterygium wilfordii]|uniref:Uncharacterized protein n=1 Tax=Tripterygium wilfordii TaxID=458696 RepID=A0A7J7CR40_TRIWF|nr:hypothetical protein HS088_TW14G00571 [Tripterygium wilfordii]
MAQVSTIKASSLAMIILVFAVATVSAQDSAMAPAPAPSMDKGAAFLLGISGSAVFSSLLLGIFGILRH